MPETRYEIGLDVDFNYIIDLDDLELMASGMGEG